MLQKFTIILTLFFTFIIANNSQMRLSVGQNAPRFAVGVYTLEKESYNRGVRFNIASQIGKQSIVLAFFTKDCAACKVEIKELHKIYKAYEAKGIKFYLVLIKTGEDKSESELIKAIGEREYTIPILYYPYPKTVFPLYIKEKTGAISAFPLAYFIGKDGKIKKIKHGFRYKTKEIVDPKTKKVTKQGVYSQKLVDIEIKKIKNILNTL